MVRKGIEYRYNQQTVKKEDDFINNGKVYLTLLQLEKKFTLQSLIH